MANAVNAYRFGIGLQLIEATEDPIDLAQATTTIAEAALRAIADDVLARMATSHGKVPGSELAIVALGRFGGSALTTGSDLDLIYLFTGDHRAQSDGRKPLDANEYFSRVVSAADHDDDDHRDSDGSTLPDRHAAAPLGIEGTARLLDRDLRPLSFRKCL